MQCLSPTVEPNVRVHEIWLGVTLVSKKNTEASFQFICLWSGKLRQTHSLPSREFRLSYTFSVYEVSRSTARSLEHQLEAIAT